MADTKITALTEDTAPTKDDLIVTVNDPAGTPANRKVTLANLALAMHPSSAHGSLSAAAWSGRLQLPSDGVALYRDTGAANVPWGPIFPLTDPVDPGTWVNQGSATVTVEKGVIELYSPSAGGAHQIRARVKSTPATPYKLTALFGISGDHNGGASGSMYAGAGLCWRDSASGKLVVYILQARAGSGLIGRTGLYKMDSPTSVNSTYFDKDTAYGGFPIWMRLEDDGTNRIVSLSSDGQHWQPGHTIGRTDFLTANQYGIFVYPYDGNMRSVFYSLLES